MPDHRIMGKTPESLTSFDRLDSVARAEAMLDSGKKNLLGVLVNAIDYEAAVAAIINAARSRAHFSVTALAVHGIMTGVLSEEHRYRLNHLDLICPDGQPVRWALNLLFNAKLIDRVYGPNLMFKLCEAAARQGFSIYLYGSRDFVLEALEENLLRRLPNLKIAGKQSSAFRQLSEAEKAEVIESIARSGAAITFVGLGCPKQEVWIYEYRDDLKMPLVAVGAAFDFHAGVKRQAPAALQNWGLEWLFRLFQEPLRLWKRYLLLNPMYLMLVVFQALKIFRPVPERAKAPAGELRFG